MKTPLCFRSLKMDRAKLSFWASLSFLLLVAFPLQARNQLGLGIQFGVPTGLSGKVWLGKANAIDFALYYDIDREVYLHSSYLFQYRDPLSLGIPNLYFYAGIGGFLGDGHWGRRYRDDDAHLGVRIPLGAEIIFLKHFNVFLELVPSTDLIPETDPFFGAALGARFVF